ncbi:MAG: exodeoxyribonuclease VII small subunit [Sedimentisphaerales bacterium]|nr:exodeoxyribonuclease VII small subunit [Sedimentisphaerales bacterium]
MAKNKQENNLDGLTFEDAIKELTSIVAKIEQGQIPLQDSLEQYEKAMALIKRCRGILQQAEKRIEKIGKEEEPEDGRRKMENRIQSPERELAP